MQTTTKILNKIEELEAYASMMTQHLTVLKKELEGSGAPTGSARKGVLSNKEIAKIKAKRQKSRMRKNKKAALPDGSN